MGSIISKTFRCHICRKTNSRGKKCDWCRNKVCRDCKKHVRKCCKCKKSLCLSCQVCHNKNEEIVLCRQHRTEFYEVHVSPAWNN